MPNPDLATVLKMIRQSKRIPALAAATHINGELREIGAVGKRKNDSRDAVEVTDKWHVGSCTKPMTSTLAGILIDEKCIQWNTTVADIIHDSYRKIHGDWHNVTLEQLLSHHGGAPNTVSMKIWETASKKRRKFEQRKTLVRELLTSPPISTPGSSFLYSNIGYAIAGHMLETCVKQDWESLLTERVFEPLGMSSAGFGAPGNAKVVDQPRGHTRIKRKLTPIEPGPQADNPSSIAPGASVHCSIEDLLKFAASHAGSGTLVSDDTLHRLHRRYGASEYSCGWYVVPRNWGNGYVLNHNGTNTYWFASMWIAPFRNAALVAACNSSSVEACDQAIRYMIMRNLK